MTRRRLTRLLLNAATAVSLVLSLSIAGVWLLSFWWPSIGCLRWRGELCLLTVAGGRTTVDNSPQVAADADARDAAIYRAAGRLLVAGESVRSVRRDVPYPPAATPQVLPAPAADERQLAALDEARRTFHDAVAAAGLATPRAAWSRTLAPPLPALAAMALAASPIFAVLARRRAARRARGGLCPACGYDLRATPARCPECGAMRAVLPPAAPRG